MPSFVDAQYYMVLYGAGAPKDILIVPFISQLQRDVGM